MSPRTLNGKLSIHLVNTSGPHADAPDGGITEVKPVGPLTVSIRLEQPPKSITMQPQGESLDITWSDGRATVTVPQLDLYSILVVERDRQLGKWLLGPSWRAPERSRARDPTEVRFHRLRRGSIDWARSDREGNLSEKQTRFGFGGFHKRPSHSVRAT